jgi:formylglycine-generating enzyme required for sulfatase activity
MKMLLRFIVRSILILIVTLAFIERGVTEEKKSWTKDQVPQYKNIDHSAHRDLDYIFQFAQTDSKGEEKAADARSYGTFTAATKRAEAVEKNSLSGASYTDALTGMEFVLVKGGCYQMGDTFGDGYPNERPVHEVCLDDFYIGKFKVTQSQWKKVVGSSPAYFIDCGDNCPVENVTWDDAQLFIHILNERTGKTYRLLTEAEWEYAARSGGRREKWAGTSRQSELGDYAWYSGNSGGQPHPVGLKKPNGLGIYDMSGNVWEWVQDTYRSDAYSFHCKKNPIYTGIGSGHAFRGGSWYYNPRGVRTTFRNHRTSGIIIRHHNIGFRIARTP